MRPLTLAAGQTRLKFSKKMFRDAWAISQGDEEVGLLSFSFLRTKTMGTNGSGEFPFSKNGKGQAVTRDGRTLATYEGKADGTLTLADGSAFTVSTTVITTLPGSINVKVTPAGGEATVWAETTWNVMGVPKTEIVIEEGSPKDDALWAVIFSLARIIVVQTLFRPPMETGMRTRRALGEG